MAQGARTAAQHADVSAWGGAPRQRHGGCQNSTAVQYSRCRRVNFGQGGKRKGPLGLLLLLLAFLLGALALLPLLAAAFAALAVCHPPPPRLDFDRGDQLEHGALRFKLLVLAAATVCLAHRLVLLELGRELLKFLEVLGPSGLEPIEIGLPLNHAVILEFYLPRIGFSLELFLVALGKGFDLGVAQLLFGELGPERLDLGLDIADSFVQFLCGDRDGHCHVLLDVLAFECHARLGLLQLVFQLCYRLVHLPHRLLGLMRQ
mmetsp:Transcript_20452/g.53221  ORF Transcript_20452/g.53221 Transcript_20452/m.53221 type:complete len:261 (-) Transcript_20452:602-1384(-)